MAKRILTTLPAGSTLILEHGSYSDKGWDGPFRLLKDLDQQTASDAFVAEKRAEYGSDDEWWKPYSGDFAAWLAKHGYIEDLPDTHVWYVGDNSFDPL